MSKTFHVQIITTQKVVYDGEVTSIVVPAEDGYLGLLANHAPLISNLKPGKISLVPAHGTGPIIFQSSSTGFLEVVKNQVTLLLRAFEK